jgi:hypothetical protein
LPLLKKRLPHRGQVKSIKRLAAIALTSAHANATPGKKFFPPVMIIAVNEIKKSNKPTIATFLSRRHERQASEYDSFTAPGLAIL